MGIHNSLLVSGLLLLNLLAGCQKSPVNSAPDPYLWLESPVTEPRVSLWLQQQALNTNDWRQQQAAYHQVREQLRGAWDHPRWMVVDIKHGQVFFYYNQGLDDHYSLYRQPLADFMAECGDDGPPGDSASLLLDGAAFVDDTTPGNISISPDAGWLAYQINRLPPSGAPESLWYLQSLTSVSSKPVMLGVRHEDWTLPAERLAWGQEAGTVYFTVSVPLRDLRSEPVQTDSAVSWQSRVYSYLAGAALSTSELVYIEAPGRHIDQLHLIDDRSRPTRGKRLLAAVTASSAVDSPGWRLIETVETDQSSPAPLWRARDIAAGSPTRGDHSIAHYVGEIRGQSAFITTGARGTGAITLAGQQQSQILIAETEAPLHSALVLGQQLVLEYLVHGSSTLRVFDLDGRPVNDQDLAMPAPVRIEAMRATAEQQLLIFYSGIVTPPRSVLVDLQNRQQTTLRQNKPDLSLHDLHTSLVRVRADDGALVPVWIADSARAQIREPGIMLMEVYGGFAAPMETSFSISRLAWLASGGAYAVAGPRGGGDYGEPWHDAGKGERRHTSISDVLSVADWLHHDWLAASGQLVISGRSHGGLLAVEAVQRAPILFSALITDAAVLDLMRLDALGGARFWQNEYQGFLSSPYQRLLAQGRELVSHPPALLVTRENDPVVAPAHSFKYVQALQAIPGRGPAAALLNVVPGNGHESSGRVSELIDDYALRWVFLDSHSDSGSAPE